MTAATLLHSGLATRKVRRGVLVLIETAAVAAGIVWGTVSLIYARITHSLLAATNRLRNDPHSRHWVRDAHHRPMSEILFRSVPGTHTDHTRTRGVGTATRAG